MANIFQLLAFQILSVLHCKGTQMNILEYSQNLPWLKTEWNLPIMSKNVCDVLKLCIHLPNDRLKCDVDKIIKKSKAFPIPFPIDTVRLEHLKTIRAERKLERNIISTYPILHERVLILMANFLNFKREFGSDIEKMIYKTMTVAQLVDRILKKRAVAFLNSDDEYLLLSGEKGEDGWESVGTSQERPPLVLENCLSYDEMKLSALVYVSGYTECINDGARDNSGVIQEEGIEEEAIIIGVIGPRFERKGRMDYEDILITEQQNRIDNGYGAVKLRPESARQAWRKLWAEFYEVPSYTYNDLISKVKDVSGNGFDETYVKIGTDVIFDNEVYYKRVSVLAETTLLEAEGRGAAAGRDVFLNVVGAGLGVWKVSQHQTDVFVLTFVERTAALVGDALLDHVTDVNFSYIRPSNSIQTMFRDSHEQGQSSEVKRIFVQNGKHPRGGINVQLERREPSSALVGEHAGKLLVMTYPWDGNAHPGNEFWLGSLTGSGDPATACSTQVSELHNAHINAALSGNNARGAGRSGLSTLPHYCHALTT